MILYHGSNNDNLFPTIKRPRIGNTAGFYLTPDKRMAQNYGKHLYAFDVPAGSEIKFLIREIGDTGVNEWVVINQKDLNELLDYEI